MNSINWYGISYEKHTCYDPDIKTGENSCSLLPRDPSPYFPLRLRLGPLLFSLYVAPLQDIKAAHRLDSMFYADDSQLYIAINLNDYSPALDNLRNCIDDVINWNTLTCSYATLVKQRSSNLLSHFAQHPVLNCFSFGNTTIELSDKVRNLGVILDKELSLKQHVNDICKKGILAIRSISQMRKYLSHDNLKCIVNAFVTSRLDYCNSVLYGLPKLEHDKLQQIQNIAAWLITGTKQKEHITPALKDLHWLPVKLCIVFKILLSTYEALNGLSPTYITSLFNVYKPARSLRSSDQLLLQVPDMKTCTYSQRSFSFYVTKLWNDLPFHIKQSESIAIFKKTLKTFIFLIVFNLVIDFHNCIF